MIALLGIIGCGNAPSGGSGGPGAHGGAPMDLGLPQDGSPATRASPIVTENQLPGSTGWLRSAPSAGLYGFASQQSFQPGDVVEIHAAADQATTASWALFRLGYYGGTGGRAVASGGPVDVPQATPPVLDPATGMVSAAWPTTFQIALDPSLVTGVYLVKLTSPTAQSYAIFVVRAATQGAPIAWPIAFNTYQAYNAWGGTSLYDNSRADWGPWHAYQVSFDRPYLQGHGAGQYFFADRDFTTFAEAQGYDIDYLADSDVDATPDVLAHRRLIVLQGHDEYWTAAKRVAVADALDSGTNLAVLGANDGYWQVRFASATATPRRALIGYKEFAASDPIAATDPEQVTTEWRLLGHPENSLFGVMFGDWVWSSAPMQIDDGSSWIWTNASVAAGALLPGLCGFEVDHRFANGSEPAGVGELGRCVAESHGGGLGLGQATLYTASSGATVFATATVSWSQALAGAGRWDGRVQQATANLFARLAGVGSVGAPPAAMVLPAGLPKPSQVPGASVSTVTTALTLPIAVAAEASGDAVVADGDRIVRVDANGQIEPIAGGAAGDADGSGPGAAFRAPRALAVASDGSIWVADTGNDKIKRIVGSQVTTIAGAGRGFADGRPGQLAGPTSLAVAASGTVYIADANNMRVRALSPAGVLSTVAGNGQTASVDGPGASASLYYPQLLALRPDGTIAFAESNDGLLRTIGTDAAHTVSTLAGQLGRMGWADGPLASAAVSELSGLAARPNGDLVLLDSASYRVRILSGGSVGTLAGGTTAMLVDGSGASAGFAFSGGAAFAGDGVLYVVDTGNHALRRLTLP
jgi:hypothetical protein